MPFNEENLLKKIGKWFPKQYRLSREAEEKVAKKFGGILPMPEVGGMRMIKPLGFPTSIKKVISAVQETAKKFNLPKVEDVGIYGSRVRGAATRYSDWDIYVKVKGKIPKNIKQQAFTDVNMRIDPDYFGTKVYAIDKSKIVNVQFRSTLPDKLKSFFK